MEWWSRMISPVKRGWIRLATRMRRSGIKQLRKEVSTCEYEDVHVMWEILRQTIDIENNNNSSSSSNNRRTRTRTRTTKWASMLEWAPHRMCRSF